MKRPTFDKYQRKKEKGRIKFPIQKLDPEKVPYDDWEKLVWDEFGSVKQLAELFEVGTSKMRRILKNNGATFTDFEFRQKIVIVNDILKEELEENRFPRFISAPLEDALL